jgi:hypothetical protein
MSGESSTSLEPEQRAGLALRLWRRKWNLLRTALAVWLLAILLWDNPARRLRLQIASMPDMDYAAEVASLRQQKRYGEAMVVAEAGREALKDDALAKLESETRLVVEERDSKLRRIREGLFGAVTGQGTSVESLVGAIAADFFVVGDIRDLLIQGTKFAFDGEADPVISTLSAIGVFTTFAPGIDVAAAILKVARKTGALTAKFAEHLVQLGRRAIDRKDPGEFKAVADNVVALSSRASPGGAIRLLRHVDHPEDLRHLSDFVRRHPDGAFVLHAVKGEGVELLLRGGKAGTEEALRIAARKGTWGMAWLREGRISLLRPHPFIGLAKAFYKGNAETLFRRFVTDFLDPYGALCIALLTTWLTLELWLLWRHF